jgi:predicted CopG family antitoxin
MRRVNIRLSDDVYFELVRRFGVRGLSDGIEVLLREALFGNVKALSVENVKPSDVQTAKASSVETAKTQDVVDAKTLSVEADRPATPAQVETIWNIAWEISSWNDVKDVVSHLVGFPVPDDPSQLTVSQASRVIEVLGKLNRKLHPRQAKTVERLLKKVAEREGLKPEEAADKYNVPLEVSKLKRYHLELLKMLAGEAK